MKVFLFCLFFSFVFGMGGAIYGINDSCTITVLYDNYRYDTRLETGWGFSCVVQTAEKQILFDTGADGDTLLKNFETLQLDCKKIDTVVISHMHGDHTGGLLSVLQMNPECTVYLPSSASLHFKNKTEEYGASYIIVESALEISKPVYSTGSLGKFIAEQSLTIKSYKGLIVITGCAHPGIIHIVEKAKNIFKDNILLVIGGFHLLGTSDREILKIIQKLKELGVKYVGPCHCSGDRTRVLFKEEFGKNYLEVGVGIVIHIDDL